MAENENNLLALAMGKYGAVQTPEEKEKELAQKTQSEKELLGSPTLFANRTYVQAYPGEGFRISFGEQYSAESNVLPTSRGAFFLHNYTAVQLAQTLINMLPEGSVTIPVKAKQNTELK